MNYPFNTGQHQDLEPLVQPRHPGHHHISSVPYGNLIFYISVGHAIALYASRLIYWYCWKRSGNANSGKFLVSLNLPIKVIVWSTLLLVIGLYKLNLSTNFKSVMNRFGRMAFCLIPFDVFLILRFDSSFVFYLELLSLHIWISRIIIAASAIHGIGYFAAWIKEGTLITKTFRILNFLGVIVLFAAVILLVISIEFFRRRIYQWFYFFHNITVLLFVCLVAIHARPGVTNYALGISFLLLIQILVRQFRTWQLNKISVIENSASQLKLVKIPVPQGFPYWRASSHIRLTYPRSNIKHWLLSTHPYTIASLPQEESINLIVKSLSDSSFKFSPTLSYCLSGPFPAIPFNFEATAEVVNIICGGSGISFGLPIYKSLLTKENVVVDLFWCVRNVEDLFVLKELKFKQEYMHIYVTGNLTSSSNISATLFDEEAYGLLGASATDEIELQSLLSEASARDENGAHTDETPAASNSTISAADSKVKSPELATNIVQGRPNLDVVFESFFTTEGMDNKWIIACGPETLITDASTWAKKRNIKIISEIYAM